MKKKIEKIILLLFLIAFGKNAAASDYRILSLSEISQEFEIEYNVISTIKEIFPISEYGIIQSPFVPKGYLIQKDVLENRVSLNQPLCHAVHGKEIYYDKTGNQKSIYKIEAKIDGKCRVDLEAVDLEMRDPRSLRIVQNKFAAVRVSQILGIDEVDEIDDILVLSNASGQILEVWFYSLSGANRSTAPFPFVIANSRNGSNRVRSCVYNFVLEVGISLD